MSKTEVDEFVEDEAMMGPYRPVEKGEHVDPDHTVHFSEEGRLKLRVPSRIYGHGTGSLESSEAEVPQE
jgi:hypothetical protein